MVKYLSKRGNSQTLTITRDMRNHLGLTDNRIEVEYYGGRIILTKPPYQEESDRQPSKED